MEKLNKKKILKIILPIFLALTVVIILISLISKIPKKELISTNTYDLYEFSSDDDYIYFSFIDENQKINKEYVSEYEISKKIYMGEKNQITIEYWGRNGKVSTAKLIKFYLDEKTYKNLSSKYEWTDNLLNFIP